MRSTSSEKNSAVFLNRCFKISLLFACILSAIALTLFGFVGIGAEPISLRKKNIPAITFKNLSPPYKAYDYFQNSKFVPFEHKASSFSPINAWWLAEASTLVYADEAFVRQRFKEAGLKRVIFFNRSGTQCFIASNSRFAIVVFRGSEIWKRNERFDPRQIISDFKTNIDIRLSYWIRGGKVHSGFKSALESVWDDMLPEIQRLQDQDVSVWVTGHSLGAALATLAADRLEDVKGLYTFGSPRVGDKEFQKRFSLSAFRVVNSRDIVANVPPKGRYRHVGELVFIDRKGVIQNRLLSAEESDDASCPEDSKAFGHAVGDKKSASEVFVPSLIRDHVPLLYAVFLWNGLVEIFVCNEIPIENNSG
jgi:hypothetical protein